MLREEVEETADTLYTDTENSAMSAYVAAECNQRCGSGATHDMYKNSCDLSR